MMYTDYMFRKYEPNKTGTDYVCGDIHGCFSDLENALAELGFNKRKDRLFSVGDLTDRGPESEKALEYLSGEWFIPVAGNHEDMIIKCYHEKTEPAEWHWANGGRWITRMSLKWISGYIRRIISLPLIIQVGSYGIVHAMIPGGTWEDVVNGIRSKNKTLIETILWKRDESAFIRCHGIRKIYAGHTIHETPVNYGILEDIDTGCFLKYVTGSHGHLTVKKLGT